MNLTEFLLARIAEDAGAARACVVPEWAGYHPHGVLAEWRYSGEEVMYVTPRDDDGFYVTCDHEGLSPSVEDNVGRHIARFDPARVLAECEAKRRIVESRPVPIGHYWDGIRAWHDGALQALAIPYADHPDYRDEWKP